MARLRADLFNGRWGRRTHGILAARPGLRHRAHVWVGGLTLVHNAVKLTPMLRQQVRMAHVQRT